MRAFYESMRLSRRVLGVVTPDAAGGHGRLRHTAMLAGALLTCALLATAGIPRTARAQNPEVAFPEEQVKAAFLYHFGTYVEWPEPASTDDVMTIAVLGDDAVADQLAQFLPGRTIARRAIDVRRLGGLGDLGNAEILFIGREQNNRLLEIIAAVADRPMLVVTDTPDGLVEGAMVNFQTLENRVRFEISVPAAERAGLRLSSRLLSAAVRVETARHGIDCLWDSGLVFLSGLAD